MTVYKSINLHSSDNQDKDALLIIVLGRFENTAYSESDAFFNPCVYKFDIGTSYLYLPSSY